MMCSMCSLDINCAKALDENGGPLSVDRVFAERVCDENMLVVVVVKKSAARSCHGLLEYLVVSLVVLPELLCALCRLYNVLHTL